MNLQIGDVVQRKTCDHGNVKCGDIRTVIAINCGANGCNVKLSDDKFNHNHDPYNLKLIKHKDIPYEEIPEGAIFTILFDLNRPVPSKCIIKRDFNASHTHMITERGDYRPTGGYGIHNASFSLATPEERMLLESHMGVQSVPPSVPTPPVKNNIHYSMY